MSIEDEMAIKAEEVAMQALMLKEMAFNQQLQSQEIPERTKHALDDYVNHGLLPGGFLSAVLENDLYAAYRRGDVENLYNMHAIMRYVVNDIPSGCWGSADIVRAWIQHKRKERAENE